MRTDCVIDSRQVICPNSSVIGYSKRKARVGDIIVYRESGDILRTARVIGRIRYAPQIGNDPPIRNWICAVTVSYSLSHCYERWIDPKDVIEVTTPKDHLRVLTAWLSTDMRRSAKRDVNEVRACYSDGWSTLAKYRAYKAERKAQMEDFERRHPKAEGSEVSAQ